MKFNEMLLLPLKLWLYFRWLMTY